jgi:hypothetical protein
MKRLDQKLTKNKTRTLLAAAGHAAVERHPVKLGVGAASTVLAREEHHPRGLLHTSVDN